MAFSLYQATAANFTQTLTAVAGFLEKGAKHFAEHGIDPATVVETRVATDMLPFRFQVVSTVHHSRGALEGVRKGLFEPPPDLGPLDYRQLQALVADARDAVAAITPAQIDELLGRDVVFRLGSRELPFVAEEFLMSFSLPNFHFHASTAYGILRAKGVPIGKRDYLGRLRMKT